VDNYLKQWWQGQGQKGGFSTYQKDSKMLADYLGIENNYFDNDWGKEHVCVSALAYYFLSDLKERCRYENKFKILKSYLLNNITEEGVWQPYWWTSVIYPTTFIIKGMLKENNESDKKIIHRALKTLLNKQSKDGSFKCDVLNSESVFYTSLVLDTLSQDAEIFKMYTQKIEKMKSWILSRQYEDGSFENSNFLVIPNPTSDTDGNYKYFKINKAGGGRSITGEIAGLFSTATAFKALSSYGVIKNRL